MSIVTKKYRLIESGSDQTVSLDSSIEYCAFLLRHCYTQLVQLSDQTRTLIVWIKAARSALRRPTRHRVVLLSTTKCTNQRPLKLYRAVPRRPALMLTPTRVAYKQVSQELISFFRVLAPPSERLEGVRTRSTRCSIGVSISAVQRGTVLTVSDP